MAEPSETGVTDAGIVTAALLTCLGLTLNGCFSAGVDHDGISFAAANALGEGIGHGVAHAACIEAGGRWLIDECRGKKAGQD